MIDNAIWQFTTHTTQVYMVAPRTSSSTTSPPLRKACCSMAWMQKKNIMAEVTTPLTTQPMIRFQLNRMFWMPSWYNNGNCKMKAKQRFHEKTTNMYFWTISWSYWIRRPTLRHNLEETSWSKTPNAITGSEVKNTLYRDMNQSLYAACPENEAYISKKNRVKPKAIFL